MLEEQQASPILARTIEISAGDPLVVPDEFQRALGLEQGGSYTVIQLDGLLILTPKRLKSLDALDNIQRVLQEENVSLVELLSSLQSIREDIYRERYGGSTQPT